MNIEVFQTSPTAADCKAAQEHAFTPIEWNRLTAGATVDEILEARGVRAAFGLSTPKWTDADQERLQIERPWFNRPPRTVGHRVAHCSMRASSGPRRSRRRGSSVAGRSRGAPARSEPSPRERRLDRSASGARA